MAKLDLLSSAYKENPSIEHYVKLRRENPHSDIEVAVIGGWEQVGFLELELRKYGLDRELVKSVVYADRKSMAELSLQLLEKIIETNSLLKSGKTHLVRRGLAIPDKLINWLIMCMLDGASRSNELYIPRELIVLIRERLGGSNPEIEQASRANELRFKAIFMGARVKAMGIKPSFRIMGKILKVAPSTCEAMVSRR
jgi:hypothetical protein